MRQHTLVGLVLLAVLAIGAALWAYQSNTTLNAGSQDQVNPMSEVAEDQSEMLFSESMEDQLEGRCRARDRV